MRGFKVTSAVAVLALLGATFMPAPAAAQTADAKFKRGLVDLATFWVEIPGTVKEESNATNPVQGLVVGTFKGLFRAGKRGLVGVYEIVSFPFPGDSNFQPILDPERSWSRFD